MTKNNFNSILPKTLGFEGGFTVDHRGETNYGVSQPTYDAYLESNKLPRKSVKELNYGEVKQFYQDEFYKKPKFDKFSEPVSAVLFDYGVNSGTSKAIKDLQEIVGSKADGVIGPKTISAVTKYAEKNGESNLVQEILKRRENFMLSLIKSDPVKYSGYAKGWANRINKLRETYLNQN